MNDNIKSIHPTGEPVIYFDRKEVKGDPETGLFSIHIQRFGIDQLVEAETPFQVRLFASRILAQHLGYDISGYNKLIFPEEPCDEDLGDANPLGGEIIYEVKIPNGLSLKETADYLLSQNNQYASEMAQQYIELAEREENGEFDELYKQLKEYEIIS